MRKIIIIISLIILFLAEAQSQKFERLADTPPMGWNSWNCFHCDGINEQVIREIADVMSENGMKKAGYEYLVIDDCWQIGRDIDGTIIADPNKFPSGIKALADYIHSKGLKLGLYSDAGVRTCAGRPGSRGYEFQDARTYATWGVDFLKYDWCNAGEQHAKASYEIMRDALYKAGRPVLFSMCEWGWSKPWLWAKDVAHMWRTTGDIRNNWDIPDAKEGKVGGGGVIVNLDMQQGLEGYAGPGNWNDPDMLEIGNGVLSEEEERAHFSLWCMLSAPLIAGNDLRNMTKSTTQILTNPELIAINQDSLGRQGFKIKDYGECEVYYKPLQNEAFAICIFNRFDYAVNVELDWANMTLIVSRNGEILDLPLSLNRQDIQIKNQFILRDLWEKKMVGNTSRVFNAEIKPHDVKVLRLNKG
jgi:alpha-galactosidase